MPDHLKKVGYWHKYHTHIMEKKEKTVFSASALAEAISPALNMAAGSLRQQIIERLSHDVVAQYATQIALERELPVLGQLARRTMDEIAGLFTKNEALAIANAFNGTMVMEQLVARPEVIVAQLSDSEELDGGVQIFGADPEVLLQKLRTLKAAHAYYLLREVVLWWHSSQPDQEVLFKKLRVE